MTLTASRTTQGFEPIYNRTGFAPNPRKYLLKPGVAVTKGDMLAFVDGKVEPASASTAVGTICGVAAESISATVNAAATETYIRVHDDPNWVFRCTFADHLDSTATGGSSTTLVDTALSSSDDDYWNGAYLYVYEGPAAGDVRTVSDYTGTSDTLTVTKAFSATPTTSTKYILLGYATGAADLVLNVGSNVKLKDENTIDANATNASDAGQLVIMNIIPAELMMDVMITKHFTARGSAA